jgi:4-amino-4-deoxy-L-arabinose transferase-like glycosyltransferase
MKKIFTENKHILIISFLGFILVYSSSFIKGYGYFIDEFYFIACSNNPAFGYVDHPPLAPIILMLYKSIFGDSLYSIRIIPALVFFFTIILAGIITREMGGKKTAQTIAAFCIFASPLFPVFSTFYSMNVFEPLLCGISIYYILKMINEENLKYWIHIGIVFGFLLLNKHTAALYIVFIVLSLLITKNRKLLFSKEFMYAILISLVIFSPNIMWQIRNDFPSLEFYRNIMTNKNVPVPFIEFIKTQIFVYNPFILPIWFTGILYLIFSKKVDKYRFPGLMFVFVFLFFLFTHSSRFDRTAFAYIGVFAGGAIFTEDFISRYKYKWIFLSYGILVIVFNVVFIPVFVPFLSYENTEKLTRMLNIKTELESGNRPLIFQTLADRIGWQERVDMLGGLYQSLPEEQKRRTVIAADNYGMAGALELLGRKYGIVNVVCGHNNYFLWSKERLHGDVLMQLTRKGNLEGLKESFGEVDSTGVYFDNPYCTMHERNLTVYICRKPKYPYEELLERGKVYY